MPTYRAGHRGPRTMLVGAQGEAVGIDGSDVLPVSVNIGYEEVPGIPARAEGTVRFGGQQGNYGDRNTHDRDLTIPKGTIFYWYPGQDQGGGWNGVRSYAVTLKDAFIPRRQDQSGSVPARALEFGRNANMDPDAQMPTVHTDYQADEGRIEISVVIDRRFAGGKDESSVTIHSMGTPEAPLRREDIRAASEAIRNSPREYAAPDPNSPRERVFTPVEENDLHTMARERREEREYRQEMLPDSVSVMEVWEG